MAVTKLKNGRWMCYWKTRDPKRKGLLDKKYFGRGPGAETDIKSCVVKFKRYIAKNCGQQWNAYDFMPFVEN